MFYRIASRAFAQMVKHLFLQPFTIAIKPAFNINEVFFNGYEHRHRSEFVFAVSTTSGWIQKPRENKTKMNKRIIGLMKMTGWFLHFATLMLSK